MRGETHFKLHGHKQSVKASDCEYQFELFTYFTSQDVHRLNCQALKEIFSQVDITFYNIKIYENILTKTRWRHSCDSRAMAYDFDVTENFTTDFLNFSVVP